MAQELLVYRRYYVPELRTQVQRGRSENADVSVTSGVFILIRPSKKESSSLGLQPIQYSLDLGMY